MVSHGQDSPRSDYQFTLTPAAGSLRVKCLGCHAPFGCEKTQQSSSFKKRIGRKFGNQEQETKPEFLQYKLKWRGDSSRSSKNASLERKPSSESPDHVAVNKSVRPGMQLGIVWYSSACNCNHSNPHKSGDPPFIDQFSYQNFH